MKTFAYIRVSSGEQDNSIEVQEKSILQYCAFRSITIDKLIIDEDVSGFKELYKRPAGSALANLPKNANVIVTKPDRLFRNTKDALITIDEWNDSGTALHIVDMGGASFNTKTAIGRLMFTAIIMNAEFERNITGERVKAVLGDRKSLRKTYCSGVFGYDNINGTMQQNIAEQAILAEIIQMKESGTPEAHIATELNLRGHKSKTGGKFHQSTIRSILKNPLHKTV